MKKLSIMMMCFAVMSLGLVSCKSSSSASGSNYDAAKKSGRSTATAILGLYNSYKSNGTINLSNASDLTNGLMLATGYANMRNNRQDAEYKKAFAAGMVSAGTGLITAENAERVIDKMNSLTGLSVNAANISNSVGTAQAIIQLLQALGTN